MESFEQFVIANEIKSCEHRCAECKDNWEHDYKGRCRLKFMATCSDCLRGASYAFIRKLPPKIKTTPLLD